MEGQSSRSVHQGCAQNKRPFPKVPYLQAAGSEPSSPLLSLPQELKNRIYEFALGGNFFHVYEVSDTEPESKFCICNSQSAHPHSPRSVDPKTDAYPKLLVVSLLRTSRQFYKETKPFLYSVNSFCFRDPTVLTNFIAKAGQKERGVKSAIQSIFISTRIKDALDEKDWDEVLQSLHLKLPGLREISFTITISHKSSHKHGDFGFRNAGRGRDTFLPGLLGLKKLINLKRFTLVVPDVNEDGQALLHLDLNYFWFRDRRDRWASEMERAILSTK